MDAVNCPDNPNIFRVAVCKPPRGCYENTKAENCRAVIHVVACHWLISRETHEYREVETPSQRRDGDDAMISSQGEDTSRDAAVLKPPNYIHQDREGVRDDETNGACRDDTVVSSGVTDVDHAEGRDDEPCGCDCHVGHLRTRADSGKALGKAAVTGKRPDHSRRCGYDARSGAKEAE